LSKGRCLAQSCNTHPGVRGRLGEMPPRLELLRTDPSWKRTAQRSSLKTQGRMLSVCSMKSVQTADLCSFGHGSGWRREFYYSGTFRHH